MLKIQDKTGQTIGVLKDDESAPEMKKRDPISKLKEEEELEKDQEEEEGE